MLERTKAYDQFEENKAFDLVKTDRQKRTLFASFSVVGAILASSCCIVPLAFFLLGISGAWISNFTALTPYKPYFVAFTFVFLSSGFYMSFRKSKTECEAGSYCATPVSGRLLKASLWGSLVLVTAALVFPYVAPYVLG